MVSLCRVLLQSTGSTKTFMAVNIRGGSRSIFKLFFFPAQNSLSFSSRRPSIIHLGCTCKHYCSKTTSFDEEKGSLESCQESTGKELNLVVSSLRVDRVGATGFGIGRRKLDLLLLAGKLYLNQDKVEKRSIQVECSDVLELIARENTNIQNGNESKVYLSRLIVNEIGEMKTKKGNLHISLTCYRNIALDRGSFNQIYRKKKYK